MEITDLAYKNSFTEDTERLLDLISRGSLTISDKKIKKVAKDWIQNYYDLLEVLDPEGRGYKAFVSLSNSVAYTRLRRYEWTRSLRIILKEYHAFSLGSTGARKRVRPHGNHFVDPTRLDELRAVKSDQHDSIRLVRMCEELDDSFINKNYISSIALTRATLDHIPPIFGCRTFSEVANSCEKSIKGSLQHLEDSSRKIADAYLHIQIRKKETLPTVTQINFSQSFDVLLGEVVRRLR